MQPDLHETYNASRGNKAGQTAELRARGERVDQSNRPICARTVQVRAREPCRANCSTCVSAYS